MSPKTAVPAIPAVVAKDWEFRAQLGDGGQAVVHRVRNRTSGEVRALKLLKRQDAYSLARMAREIDALLVLGGGPNIVPLLDHDSAKRWYMMPVGQTLHAHWKTLRTGLAAAELFDASRAVFLEVLAGLEAAHRNDLVHRDVKPKNVLILKGVAVLSDFGIVHDPSRTRLTTKPAQNKFAPHVAALYDPAHAPKSMDCFALAALWAWMLANDPRVAYGNYHYRWHDFVADPRCEIARAVLGVCSHEPLAPRSAQELRAFVEREFRLAKSAMAGPSSGAVARVVRAQAYASAEATLRDVEKHAAISAVSTALGGVVWWIYQQVKEMVAELQDEGVEIYLRKPSSLDCLDGDRTEVDIEPFVARAETNVGRDWPVFDVSTSAQPGQISMLMQLVVHWAEHPSESGRLAYFGVVRRHVVPELCSAQLHDIGSGGRLTDVNGSIVSPESYADAFRAFFLNPDHHAAAKRPIQ